MLSRQSQSFTRLGLEPRLLDSWRPRPLLGDYKCTEPSLMELEMYLLRGSLQLPRPTQDPSLEPLVSVVPQQWASQPPFLGADGPRQEMRPRLCHVMEGQQLVRSTRQGHRVM